MFVYGTGVHLNIVYLCYVWVLHLGIYDLLVAYLYIYAFVCERRFNWQTLGKVVENDIFYSITWKKKRIVTTVKRIP